MPKIGTLLILALGVVGLAGCTIFPSRAPDRLVDHDFGPIHTHRMIKLEKPVLLRVKSPLWLSGTSIHYRLLYADPTAIHVYADNRWIAPPDALLKARIRARLGLGFTPSAHEPRHIDRLVLVLSRFDQNFLAPHKAFVRLAIEGRLYSVTTGKLLAIKTLSLHQACAPNVQGAIKGLSALARAASATLAHFVQQTRVPKD